jgi:hypothetical protein
MNLHNAVTFGRKKLTFFLVEVGRVMIQYKRQEFVIYLAKDLILEQIFLRFANKNSCIS